MQFQVQVADIDEAVRAGEHPADYVQRMAREKAQAIASGPHQVVLAADTSVVLDGQIFGKPDNQAHAMQMLMALAGRTHQVYTAVSVSRGAQRLERLSISEVEISALNAHQASAYWHTGEPCDKAGGYAIQGTAAGFIKHISGSYSGIMGLPLFEVREMLDELCVTHAMRVPMPPDPDSIPNSNP